jgi:putative aldouronate transport system substrate-binding protein
MKKLLFLVLAIGCVSFAFAGGQGDAATTGGVEVSAAGVLPIVQETVELDVLVNQHALVTDYATNDATLWLEEKTNVKINWQTVPNEGREEKINIILASGDLPEVFYATRITTKQEAVYGSEEQLFLPLNDLIDEQGFWFKKALTEFDFDVEGMIKSPDGNIYALPTLSNCYHCFNSKRMWLNTQWTKNLGLDIPTTTDEFYEVLKAFKEQDANGNGDPNDEYPLVGSTQGLWNGRPELYLLNSFLFYPEQSRPFSLVNGKATSVADDPRYREGLRYMNKLHKEGLLYEATYTQDGNQLKNMTNNPDIAIVGALPAGNIIGGTMKAYDRAVQFEGISPLKGPEGVQYSLYNPYSAVYFGDWVITAECENPAAAFKYADFLYDWEATMAVRYGQEGRDWRYAGPDELGLDAKPAQAIIIVPWGGTEPRNDNYQWIGPFFESLALRLGRGVVPGTDPYTVGGLEVLLYNVTSQKMVPYQPDPDKVANPIPVKYTVDENDELLTLKTEVTNHINESRVRFINGDLDLDADWDEYVKTLKSLGVQTWIDIYQKAFDRQFK